MKYWFRKDNLNQRFVPVSKEGYIVFFIIMLLGMYFGFNFAPINNLDINIPVFLKNNFGSGINALAFVLVIVISMIIAYTKSEKTK